MGVINESGTYVIHFTNFFYFFTKKLITIFSGTIFIPLLLNIFVVRKVDCRREVQRASEVLHRCECHL